MDPSRPLMARILSIGTIASLTLLLAACSAPADTSASAPEDSSPSASAEPVPVAGKPGTFYPNAIVAIGHSGLTGDGTAGTVHEAPKNSWATGTNPDVNSIYRRILELNPGIEGHNANLAINGSGVASLLDQASEALELDPLPELFVVMTIDNDMRCNGTDADNIPAFSEGLDEVLSVISAGAPESTVFITSQWASVEEYTSTMLPIDVDFLTGDGICDVVDPGTTTINPEKAAGLQAIVDLYETAVQQVCAQYPTCQWDNGAAHAMDLEPEHLGPDYSHLSIAGQHALAELEWAALYGE